MTKANDPQKQSKKRGADGREDLRKEICVVILTAIDKERAAVKADVDNWRLQKFDGEPYDVGEFSHGDTSWTVVLKLVGKGQASAAAGAQRAIDVVKPDVMLFVGIAGRLDERRKLGDVVAATSIHNYESGKDGKTFVSKREAHLSTHELVEAAHSVTDSDAWHERMKRLDTEATITVVVEPIASGEKTVKDVDSDTAVRIRKLFPDAVAVEAEGYAFLEAVYRNQAVKPVKALVIRGISDLLDDKEKTDALRWQERASSHASAFAFELLAHLSNGEQPEPPPSGRPRPREKPKIAITMGDANGIGPEIILKALAGDEAIWKMCIPIVVGSERVLGEERRSLWPESPPITLRKINEPEEAADKENQVSVIDVGSPAKFGTKRRGPNADIALLSAECTRQAVQYAKKNSVAAIVSGPVSKESLLKAGQKFRGHVELIASEMGVNDYGVMYLSPATAIAIATGHMTLREALTSMTKSRISDAIVRSALAFEKWRPDQRVVGVCSVNPHGGEGGWLGKEDLEAVLPAIKDARRRLDNQFEIDGPLAADAVFRPQLLRKYKLVIAMYHDQGKAAVAALGSNDFVGAFVGDGLTRTTVTHGTGFDIAGQGIASPANMKTAIRQAVYLSPEGSRYLRESPSISASEWFDISVRLNANADAKNLLGEQFCKLPQIDESLDIAKTPSLKVLFGPGSTTYRVAQEFIREIRRRDDRKTRSTQGMDINIITNNVEIINYVMGQGSDFKQRLTVFGGNWDLRQNSLGPTRHIEEILDDHDADICVISCSAIAVDDSGSIRLGAYSDDHVTILRAILASHAKSTKAKDSHPLIIVADAEKLKRDDRHVYATSEELPDDPVLLLEYNRRTDIAAGKAQIVEKVAQYTELKRRALPAQVSS